MADYQSIHTGQEIDDGITKALTAVQPGGLTKSSVGLGNVDNTSDANKPVSTAQQAALDLKLDESQVQDVAQEIADNTADLAIVAHVDEADPHTQYILKTSKGSVNGVASLDGGGKVPASQLPSSVMELKGFFNPNTTDLTNGVGDPGDVWEADTVGSHNFGSGNISFKVGDWAVYASGVWHKSVNSNEVTSVNGKTGTVVVDKGDVGLGNVDNTSDDNKPVSTAQATAISASITNLKAESDPFPVYLTQTEGDGRYRKSDIPDEVFPAQWRVNGGNSGYARSKQGGAAQGLGRRVIPIYNRIKAGDIVIHNVWKTSDYTESSNLNGATWQIGVQTTPEATTIMPAYWIPDNQRVTADTPVANVPASTQITKTFDNSKLCSQVRWVAPHDIEPGSQIALWIWAKNGFGVTTTNDVADKSRIPAGEYFGDFFAYDINATNYNNNTMALFTDGAITGMSDSVRASQTNAMLRQDGTSAPFSRTGYWCLGVANTLTFGTHNAISYIADSVSQNGGSSCAIAKDESYTFGVPGKLTGLRFPGQDLAAANDQFSYYANNPSYNVARREQIQFTPTVFNAQGVNDSGALVGNIPQLEINHTAFLNLAEFTGKIMIVADLAPFNAYTPGASNPPSDFAISDNTLYASTNAARLRLNELYHTHPRYAKCYPVNKLLTNKRNFSKPKRPRRSTRVTGSGAPAYAGTIITNAVWASTSGGIITYTVNADVTDKITINDWLIISGITASVGSLGGTFQVLDVTWNSGTSTGTIIVSCKATSSVGTYTSGGTVTSRNYIISLSKGNFEYEHEGYSITSVNFVGAANWRYGVIDRVTSPTTAILANPPNTTPVNIAPGEIFFLGGAQLYNFEGSTPGNFDVIHRSDCFYGYLYLIGERGVLSPGIVPRLPELI